MHVMLETIFVLHFATIAPEKNYNILQLRQ